MHTFCVIPFFSIAKTCLFHEFSQLKNLDVHDMFAGNQHSCVMLPTYMHKPSKNLLVSCPAHACLVRGWGLGTRLELHFSGMTGTHVHCRVTHHRTSLVLRPPPYTVIHRAESTKLSPQEDIASNYPPTHFCPPSLLQVRQKVFDFLHGLFYPLQLEPVRNSTDW